MYAYLSLDSNIHNLSYFNVSDGDDVSLQLGNSDKTGDVGPKSRATHRRFLLGNQNKCICKKRKCKKPKCFNWCKQNCACCKNKNGKPENLNSEARGKEAKVEIFVKMQKCEKWRKKSNAKKCKSKFGIHDIV